MSDNTINGLESATPAETGLKEGALVQKWAQAIGTPPMCDEQLYLLMKAALEHVNASAQTGHGQDGIAVVISFSALDHVKKAIAAIGWQQHIQMEKEAYQAGS